MLRAKGSDLGHIFVDPGGIGHTVIQYINFGSEIVLPGRWGPTPRFVRDFLSQNLYTALRFTSFEGREAAYKRRFRASPHMSVHPQPSGIEPQEYGFSSVHLAA